MTTFSQISAPAAPYVPAATPTLAMQGVSRVFGDGSDTQVTALHPTDFAVYPGELVAVVGPSGSGKSTLLTLAGALQRPTAGRIAIAGQDLAALSERQLADFRLQQIGFVLQSSNLIPYLKVREQLTLVPQLAGRGGAAARALADDLLGHLGLSDRAGHYPAQLSGGQKQRVAIARALANDPDILLADEPTGALDSATGRMVMDLFRQLNREQEKTIVFITHNPELAAETTRTVTMSDGRLENGVLA